MTPNSPISSLTILLAGQPNVGKSTLFNALTGSKQRIANYPGATVEKKIGEFIGVSGQILNLIDLPGTYSLNAKTEDEKIAVHCILGQQPDVPPADAVLVIGEAFHLDRSLFLFAQIRKLHPKAVLVLNMMDELKNSGKTIDIPKLAKILNAPVFGISAARGDGLSELRGFLDTLTPHKIENPQSQNSSINDLETKKLFSDIDKTVAQVTTQQKKSGQIEKHAITRKLDRVLLHPVLGPIFFILILSVLFQALFTGSAPLMDSIEAGIGVLADLVRNILPDGIVKSLIIDGVLGGVGSVLVFVPQIAVAFLLIGFLESSGYLSRGAFLVDRLMRAFGLEGRSFIPLISSFACAIPGILATRTIPNYKQRLITILVAPLMTCSARLPVYTLLIATFVPAEKVFGPFNKQGLTLLGLFLLGIVAMMIVSAILDRLLKSSGKTATFVMELPRYRLPQPKNLLLYIGTRVFSFIKTAGSVIFLLSLILWALAYFPHSSDISKKYDVQRQALNASPLDANTWSEDMLKIDNAESGEWLRESFMGKMGVALEPFFRPMGADWRMGVALISSFAAREVFVSTLGVVFNLGDADEESESLRAILQNAKNSDGTQTYSFATAMAVLVFFALAAQCTSTLAVIKRETNSLKWPLITFGYMSVLAYVAAVITFRILG